MRVADMPVVWLWRWGQTLSMSLRPLIAIFGTTGVGKSNLAIELALRISQQKTRWKGARIINADAMQVYAGLDVITNKVPESERHGVEHLLMGFKQPGEQYVVGQWVKDAICAVSSSHRLVARHLNEQALHRSTKHI